MPKMTVKYSTALKIAQSEKIDTDHREQMYDDLQEAGWFWDSDQKQWFYTPLDEGEAPTPQVMLRVWADSEIVEEAAEDLIDLIKRSKLPWQLLEKSTPYRCRPPKQRESRVYLKFLPQRN